MIVIIPIFFYVYANDDKFGKMNENVGFDFYFEILFFLPFQVIIKKKFIFLIGVIEIWANDG